jgi:WD40 repeat protein
MHNNEIITAGWDGTVRVVNFNTLIQRMILSNEYMGRSPHVTVSDSGNHIISFSYDSDIRPECRANSVKIWNMKNGRLKWVINNTGEHRSLRRSGACLTHNDLLYVISDSGYLSVFEVKSNTLIKRVFLSLNLRTMCIHEGRNLVFAGDDSGTVFICRLGSIDLLRTLTCHRTEISEMRIHETNSDIVVTTGFDGAIKFWELPCFSCIGSISGNLGRLWTHDMRKDILFAGSDEGDIFVFDTQDMDNCRLKGTLDVYNNFYIVKPVDSNLFYTNNITYLDLIDKNTGKPMTGKESQYLLNSCNRESVLHEMFRTRNEIKEFSTPSLKMKLQLPPSL